MVWTPYHGDDYLDFPRVRAWCEDLAEAHPQWVSLTTTATSRQGRPILLLTVGDQSGQPMDRPAFWLDGGTHASEWTGVMATLYAVSHWVERLAEGDEETCNWFTDHTVFAIPCISPDGFQALHEGAPWLRSTLRPPPPGTIRSGLAPGDLTGDGVIRQMRWRHPAGPFVCDEEEPTQLRRRTLDDPPESAWFLCTEGELIAWDGVRWTQAILEHGLDLNRNFPAAWKPFSMFGMDGGRYPTSEPESQAVVEAFAQRPFVGAAVTNHTYTGALLMAPHRPDDEVPGVDVRLLSRLARDAVEGTGYRVLSIYPDFTYDSSNPIVGVWDDTISSVFGVAGYTLELWDPFAHAGLENRDPAKFWTDPDPAVVRKLTAAFADEPGGFAAWTPFEHPQLGPVEIGGLDLTRTIHNPPTRLLRAECERGLAVFQRVRRAVPRVAPRLETSNPQPGTTVVRLTLENHGFLPTSSLSYGETIGAAPPVSATLTPGDGLTLVTGPRERTLDHMDGWGTAQIGGATNTLYARLQDRGHRTTAQWVVQGRGTLEVAWQAGRAGRGVEAVEVGD